MKSIHRIIIVIASVTALSSLAQAQTTNSYTGATGSAWETATNWSLGIIPTNSSEVYVTNGTQVRISSAAVATNLFIGGASGTSSVQLRRNGTFSLTVGGNITMGSGAGDATLQLGVSSGGTSTLTIGNGTGSILDGGGAGATTIEVFGPVTLNLATVTVDNLNINQNSAGSMTIATNQTWNVTTTRIGELYSNLAYSLTVAGTLNSTTINLSPAVSAGTNSATLNLNSGGLIRSTTLQRTGAMSSAFNWNDGTIQNGSGTNLTVQGSTTNILTMSLAGTGTHTFNADSGRTITVASTAILADKSGEQGTLVKTGAGELIFQGTNTYTGLTTINAGTLSLSNGSAIADTGAVTLSNASGATLAVNSSETIGSLRGGGSTGGNVSLASGQTLTVAETGNQTFAGAITNTGGLTKSGAGTTTLSGANTYSGATTVAAGRLQIGDGGTSGAIGSTSGIAISNGATLAFNRTDSYGGNFTRTVSGAGGVVLSAGTLTLQNTGNSFTGGVTVNGGTFKTLGNSAGNTIVVNSGGTLAMAGTDTWGAATTTNTPAITINAGGTMTSDGQFNSLRDLTLNGGTVSLNGGLNSSAPAFVLGGTVTAGGATTSTIAVVSGSNNAIRLGRQGTNESTIFNVTNAAGQLLVGTDLWDNFGSISGLTKSGSGTMVLSASNTYTGPTAVTAGTLQVGNGGTTGSISASSALSVSNGATLAFNRTDNYGGAWTHTISGAGTVAINGGNLTLNAAGSSGYSTNLSFVINNGGTATMGHSDMFGGTGWDATTSPGFTVNAGGTLASSNNFNTLWNLNLNGGTLLANGGANAAAQAFALAGTVTVGGSSASLIQAGTNGNGLNNINISGNGNTTLTFNVADVTGNANADLTVTANLQNSRSTQSFLNKTGAGLMVLAGSNAYTGSTTVSAGTLQVGNGGTTGSLGTTTGVAISNGATLGFNRTDSYGGNFTLTISGAGGVALSAGTLTLQNTSNSFTGGVTVNGGKFLTLGNSAGSNIVVNSGGTFGMAGSDTWGNAAISSSPAVTLNSGATMTSDGQFNSLRNLTLNRGTVSLNGGLNSTTGAFVLGGTVTAGGSLTSSITAASGSNNFIRLGRETAFESTTFNVTNSAGLLTVGVTLADNFGASTAGLIKSGNGILSLSASNSYTGGTTISGGTLELANGGSVAGNITNNATLSINRTDSSTLSNVVSGSGALTKSGAGTATLTASNTYSGATTISGGTLELANGGSVAGNITNNATLSINRTDISSLSNVVSGSGALTKSGSGTVNLTAASTYTGATAISSGRLQIGSGGTSGGIGSTSGIGISNGATLAFNRTDTYGGNFTRTISGAGGIVLSAGTLSLQNTGNSFTGGVTINGGKLLSVGASISASNAIVVNNGGTLGMGSTDTWGAATTTNTPAITINAGGTMTSDGQFNSLRDLTLNGGTVSLNGGLNSSAPAFVLGGTVTAGGATTSTIAVVSGSNNAIRLGRQGTNESTTFNVSDNNGQLLVGTELWDNFGALSGLTKSGNGTLILSSSNSYTAGTLLSGGTLRLNHVNAAGTGTITQSSGASTLQINTTGTVANAMNFYNINTMQTVTLSGNKTLNNATYTVDAGTTTTESGVLSGTGGITKQGTGTLIVTASNSFTGNTVVNAGLLNLNSSTGSALGASTNVTVAATLLISQSSQVSDSAAVTLSGGTITRGSGVSEVFGNLNVTGASYLDFGSGTAGNLAFGTYTASALLTVNNFLPGNKLQFASGFDSSLLPTGGNLSNGNFSFSNGFTTGTEGGYFTITAIPEPSTYVAAAGLLMLFLCGSRARRARAAKTGSQSSPDLF